MIRVAIPREVYEFNELDEEVQNSILHNFLEDFYITNPEDERVIKAGKKADDLQTPWFFHSYLWELCEDDVMKEINDYYFYNTGCIAGQKEFVEKFKCKDR